MVLSRLALVTVLQRREKPTDRLAADVVADEDRLEIPDGAAAG